MRKTGLFILLCTGFLMGAGEGLKAEEPAGAAGEEKRELLAEHETLAKLKETKYRTCLGRTGACPDRCGNSGEFAEFEIVKYLHYSKPGKYGDKKQTSFRIQVSDYHRKPKGDPEILRTVKQLEPGGFVLLSWRHDYVTRGGSSFPERPVTKLEAVSREAAETYLKE
jgi:hypothetical protein